MKKDKGVIPKNSRYVPLTQQPYCCVPTSIQMVMLKHNIPLLPVELMAHHLDTIVSPEKRELFWNLCSTRNRPPAGWGTRISEDKTVNKMFVRLKIPLKMKFNLIESFETVEELGVYLYKSMRADTDVLVCYDVQPLFNTKNSSGHVCVFDRIDRKAGEVRFIDPESNVAKWRTVKLSKLYKAMQIHGNKHMGGCWELKVVDKRL